VPSALPHQIAVDEGLAEADQARQRRLELVRNVGKKFTLRHTRALDGLGHSVKRRPEHPYLVLAAYADSS
jgi:hypothetical protein